MLKVGIAGPISIPHFAKYLDHRKHRTQDLPPGLGGTPVTNLVEAMLQNGRRVVVFTLERSIDREAVFEGDQIKLCVGPYRPTRRARDLFSVERSYLAHAIEREQPDLVHAHWTYEFAMGALETRCPVLVTAHDAPLRILRHLPDPYRLVRLYMAWSVARRARHITAVSSYIADHFRRYLRFRYPIPVVPNSLAPECFELGRLRLSRQRSGPFTVATALTGWKGLKNGPVALQAFGILRQELPEVRLILFGQDYAQGGPADLWARAKSLTRNVEFAGPVTNSVLLHRLASEVDVLLHPSLEESFGMSIAEGMALGLAVVAGKASGAVPEILESGAAGMLADVNSPSAVADTLARLASKPYLRDQMGRSAFGSACRRFRGELVITQYQALYGQICRTTANNG